MVAFLHLVYVRSFALGWEAWQGFWQVHGKCEVSSSCGSTHPQSVNQSSMPGCWLRTRTGGASPHSVVKMIQGYVLQTGLVHQRISSLTDAPHVRIQREGLRDRSSAYFSLSASACGEVVTGCLFLWAVVCIYFKLLSSIHCGDGGHWLRWFGVSVQMIEVLGPCCWLLPDRSWPLLVRAWDHLGFPMPSLSFNF